jgi:hypothetical protein
MINWCKNNPIVHKLSNIGKFLEEVFCMRKKDEKLEELIDEVLGRDIPRVKLRYDLEFKSPEFGLKTFENINMAAFNDIPIGNDLETTEKSFELWDLVSHESIIAFIEDLQSLRGLYERDPEDILNELKILRKGIF